tara:strand:+ start:639 stop:1442 length:804 start_codon:yes stop_codon:yes gene_type:complete
LSTTRSKLNSIFSSKTKSFGPSDAQQFANANLSDNTNWQEWSSEAHINNLAQGFKALSSYQPKVKCFYQDLYTDEDVSEFWVKYNLVKGAIKAIGDTGDLYARGYRFQLSGNWLDGLETQRWAINGADTAIFTLHRIGRNEGAKKDGVAMLMWLIEDNPALGKSNAAISKNMPDFADVMKSTRPENGENRSAFHIVMFEPDCGMAGGIDNWYGSMLKSVRSLQSATLEDGVTPAHPDLLWKAEKEEPNEASLQQQAIAARESGVQAG